MMLTKTISPQNSVIMLLEYKHGTLPSTMGKSLVGATKSCVVIGTYPQPDGDTTIMLTDEEGWSALHKDMAIVFTGKIETPGRTIQVCTALWDEVFSVAVKSVETEFQILANHDYIPNKICILLK